MSAFSKYFLSIYLQAIEKLLSECKQCSEPFVLPNKDVVVKPGEELVHVLVEHSKNITLLALRSDGRHCITGEKKFVFLLAIYYFILKIQPLMIEILRFPNNNNSYIMCKSNKICRKYFTFI